MASPAIAATAEDVSSSPSNSHTMALPTGIVANQLLLGAIAKGGDGAATQNAVTGWTELLDENLAFGAAILYRWTDGLGGTPETSPLAVPTTGTATRMASICARITGAENPAIQPPQISAVATGTSNAPNPNSLSPTGGAKDYLWITFFTVGGTEAADTDTYVNNAATGYGGLLQKTSSTGGVNVGAILGWSSKQANAASEDAVWPAASLDASAAWRAFTIAIHPPGGGAAASLVVPPARAMRDLLVR